jgi:predicted transcriptional regulator
VIIEQSTTGSRARSAAVTRQERSAQMSAPFTKISVNLSNEVIEVLREMAARDNVTMTEILRRAISTQKFLEDAQAAGKAILLRDEHTKETERLVFR